MLIQYNMLYVHPTYPCLFVCSLFVCFLTDYSVMYFVDSSDMFWSRVPVLQPTCKEYGKPVSRVIYVTHGTCIGERVGGCPVLEYHQVGLDSLCLQHSF